MDFEAVPAGTLAPAALVQRGPDHTLEFLQSHAFQLVGSADSTCPGFWDVRPTCANRPPRPSVKSGGEVKYGKER